MLVMKQEIILLFVYFEDRTSVLDFFLWDIKAASLEMKYF